MGNAKTPASPRSLQRLVMAPSEDPCPKCASGDIARQYRERTDFVDSPYPKGFARYHLGSGGLRVTKEHIHHHCRCCHYEWCGECHNEVAERRP